MGQVVLSYADKIFSAGRELMTVMKPQPGSRPLRLNVGMTDALSKLIAFEILKPAFRISPPVHVICRQAEIGRLVGQLYARRLDIVLPDEPTSSSLKAKTFNHRLGRSGVTFCAVPATAAKLRRNFPKSLHQASALLPSDNMGMRAALEKWFDAHDLRPRLVGEFEEPTLKEVAASGAVQSSPPRALKHYNLKNHRRGRRLCERLLRDHRRAAGEAPRSSRDHRACERADFRLSAIEGRTS